MQLCNRLLEVTGNSLYADYIENSIYNALLASLKADASQIAKYSPLEGWRHEGEEQCGMHINCCNANGPRGFALIPAYAYQTKGETIFLNLYSQSESAIQLPGKKEVKIVQQTDYPATGVVRINVDPAKKSHFTMSLRIPSWSKQTSVKVNGNEVSAVLSGSYCTIARDWNKGDQITVELDMRAKVVELNQAQAIVRGPVVLARDSRFNDGAVDEASVIAVTDGYVELTPTQTGNFAWMSFTAPLVLGTDLEGNRTPTNVHFCDFASAGNTWDKKIRYRVWLPKTLNVIHAPYKPYSD